MKPGAWTVVWLVGAFVAPAASAQGVDPGRVPESGTRPSALPEPAPPSERPVVQIPYDPERPIPEGFVRRSGPRVGIMMGGAALFGFAYATSVVLAVTDAELTESDVEEVEASRHNQALLAPLIGPFAALGTSNRTPGESVLLTVDGVLQAGGLAMFLVGLATREHWLERAPKVGWSLSPSYAGLSLSFTQ
jgi:hypothetical protein